MICFKLYYNKTFSKYMLSHADQAKANNIKDSKLRREQKISFSRLIFHSNKRAAYGLQLKLESSSATFPFYNHYIYFVLILHGKKRKNTSNERTRI